MNFMNQIAVGKTRARSSKEVELPAEDPKLYYSTEAYEYRVESAEDEVRESKQKPKPKK